MINLSVVLYNTSYKDINNIFESLKFVKCDYKLYVIDNSPSDILNRYFLDRVNVEYIHNPSNPGFGASHNIALRKSIKDQCKYHFVVNPDVFFKNDVITPMISYMEDHTDVGMMMPQILNLDGTIQNLPKLLPSPLDVLSRKIKWPKNYYNKFIDNYELRFADKSLVYEAPILSGCFTLFRVSSIESIGIYDDRFFMYFEDWDLSRRMNHSFKTIYYPIVSIYHGYESGANRSKRLFKIFVRSAITYFNKWGWFFDSERIIVNKKTLSQFK